MMQGFLDSAGELLVYFEHRHASLQCQREDAHRHSRCYFHFHYSN